MSLNAICSECEKQAGYFTGRNVKISNLEPEDGNETDNLFSVGKVDGHAGCTFSNLKTINEVFICGDCLKTKMPNTYKLIIKRSETYTKNIVGEI